jgi:hypothetical protein
MPRLMREKARRSTLRKRFIVTGKGIIMFLEAVVDV